MPTDHLACQYELCTICGAFDLLMHQGIMHVYTCRYIHVGIIGLHLQ